MMPGVAEEDIVAERNDRRTFLKNAGAAFLACGIRGNEPAAAVPLKPVRAEGSPERGGADPWIEVDRKAIAFNVRQIKKKVGGRPILAVLKCNAYGHGLVGVAEGLASSPVHGLVVGRLGEALALRAAGITRPILNLGPFGAPDTEAIVRSGISQAVCTDAVRALEERARTLETRVGVHVEIDTGLGRTGIPHESALAYLREVAGLPHVTIEGTFQSFSEDPEFDRIQLDRFLAVTGRARAEGLPVGLRHASASTAIFSYGEEFYLDAVRPGIAVYGHYPTREEHALKRLELSPALALKARVSFVKDLRPGETLSYFRRFVAEKPERVVTAALGYADGVPPGIASGAMALIRGKRYPFFCDVSANHSYIRVTGDLSVSVGDEIAIVGRQGDAAASLWDLAQAAGTSDYKVLIGLNPSLARVFTD